MGTIPELNVYNNDKHFLDFVYVGLVPRITTDQDNKWDDKQMIMRSSINCVGYMPG